MRPLESFNEVFSWHPNDWREETVEQVGLLLILLARILTWHCFSSDKSHGLAWWGRLFVWEFIWLNDWSGLSMLVPIGPDWVFSECLLFAEELINLPILAGPLLRFFLIVFRCGMFLLVSHNVFFLSSRFQSELWYSSCHIYVVHNPILGGLDQGFPSLLLLMLILVSRGLPLLKL